MAVVFFPFFFFFFPVIYIIWHGVAIRLIAGLSAWYGFEVNVNVIAIYHFYLEHLYRKKIFFSPNVYASKICKKKHPKQSKKKSTFKAC